MQNKNKNKNKISGILKNLIKVNTPDKNIAMLTEKISNIEKNLDKVINNLVALEDLIKINIDVENLPKAKGTLATLQKADAYLLKLFHDICAKHNLTYWLDFGTLIGAIRHKGFIPWDDDMDVGMLSQDIKKLPQILDIELANTNLCYKVIDSGVLIISHKELPFLWLDVFPYSFYKPLETEKEKNDLALLLNLNNSEHLLSNYKQIKKNKDEIKKITSNVLKNSIINDNTTLFLDINATWGYKKGVYDFKTIFPLKQTEFDGYMLKIPNNINKYLNWVYGDFYKLPSSFNHHQGKMEKLLDKLDQDELEKFYRIKIIG